MNRIASSCGRAGHNIKEIAELIREKITLTTRIHAASVSACGLPHLNVREIGLARKAFGEVKALRTREDEESLDELNAIGTMLETHAQWKKKEHVFCDWMVTVVSEAKKDGTPSSGPKQIEELSSFVTLLRHVTKKRLYGLKNNGNPRSTQPQIFKDHCVSRLLRSEAQDTEIEIWRSETARRLNETEINVEEKMHALTTELREMLGSVPNCVEV